LSWKKPVTARLTACAALAAATATTPLHAKDFYQGKTLNLIVSVAPGAGYDLNARAVARYIGAHIPGHPSIVVQNQPGAGGVTLANKMYGAGPFDGLTMGACFGGTPTTPLLQPQGIRFDAQKFNWIGSTSQEVNVSYAWHTAPVQSLAALMQQQLIVGAQAPGTTQYDLPVLANALFGTKYKVISGYDGTAKIQSAMESGEIQGVGATAFTTLISFNQSWIDDKKVRIIMQWGPKKAPGYENVPSAIELAKTPEDKAAVKLAEARLVFGRPFFMPPNVPADRVEIIRRAFDATMKDPGFIAEEKKLKFDVDPLSGAQVAKVLAEAYATPPAIIERVRKIIAGTGQ
jgi:tripartite-type tricarboxylate transporter receptor subunit TctC